MNRNVFTLVCLCFVLVSCSNYNTYNAKESSDVRLYFSKSTKELSKSVAIEDKCEFINEVVGSNGHWYSYLFITNHDLTLNALDDMKNKAHSMGANTILIYDDIDFTTSVTFLGQAYRCDVRKK